ncbi:hypothetical protein OXX79_009123 [Metschnikowia pulcherrima]
MANSPRIIYECPNVENTLPLELFRAQSPARYSQADGDKLVLYSGNASCLLEICDGGSVKVDEKIRESGPEIAVFVLDMSLVFWFTKPCTQQGQEFGVDLPYPSIALHALKEVGNEVVLYLQVLSSAVFQTLGESEFTQTVELMIRVKNPKSSENMAKYPLLSHNHSIQQMYEALGTCSAMHYDSQSESDENGGENSDVFGPGHEWITADTPNAPQIEVPASWVNSGDADDLGMAGPDEDLDGEAGMNVAVEYVTVAGVVRRRASISEEANKQRRIL